ncbi:MAG: PIN domain-containing protein [Spirochaetaceae bacterium]|jgi:PIN domain nuclease of toxin-antitoxin system|nr:PIN domain-containing protein [Spirochaetaceae bacterium]
MPVNDRYVLDACAVIAFLNKEPGAETIVDLIQRAEYKEIALYMTSIQALEVYYDRIRIKGRDYADTFLHALYTSSIKILDHVSRANIRIAGHLKTRYSLSLADAVACAAAYSLSAFLVTADHHELTPVEKGENIPFFWFR